ncbi:MAG TPA: PAS domain S-box protein [Methanocella sp.]|uniref:PAS domain S-box protein n=1 Tax=Methanocella sp. TaxID=2052833 RepID=UPI002B5D4948|nr:PAS domain S-box protein [Methanocella sp.]HTY89654.1 PAS domain S-box protein [Methanocella sp.]
MDSRSLSEQIKEVLKANPKGMTVGEVAESIGMNSQSMGRHLDVLAASGQVEVHTFGRSKVFYLSQRVPVFSLINISPDMVVMLDKDLKVTNVNQKFLDFTGTDREDTMGRCITDVSFPIRFEPDIVPYARQALEGIHSRIEALYKRGIEELYFQIKFIPILYENGDIGANIIFEDITMRKRLEEQRSFLAAIVESSNDAIIGKKLDGTITSWNKSAERIYGYTAEEMIGNKVSVIVPPERRGEVNDIFEKILRGERIMHHETERVRKDGKRITVSLTVSPIIDSDGQVLGASTIAYEVDRIKPYRSALTVIGVAAIFFVLDLSCRSILF